jgi:hypothetical protein
MESAKKHAIILQYCFMKVVFCVDKKLVQIRRTCTRGVKKISTHFARGLD